jgi:hypothetical protein
MTAVPVAGAGAVVDRPIAVTRRRIDVLLVGVGAAAAVVLFVAAGLLLWGSTFSSDYVHDELGAQAITFPPAASLEEDGRSDLVGYADAEVDTGAEAEAYASLIATHVDGIADGATYSELGDTERAADAAVEDATADGAPAAEIAALEEEAAAVTGQRDAVFKGEMLRGTLLSTFAWDTIGRIAGIAAWVAFAAAAVMSALVVAGGVHLRRLHHAQH